MSDKIHEQVSQFVDDEMSAEECDFFVRRLERDADARSRYLRYQLIGAAVRGEAPLARYEPSSRWARTGMAASIILAVAVGFVAGDSVLTARQPVQIASESPLMGLQADVTALGYLIHHTGASSGLNRTLMHASVFSGIETDGADRDQDEPLE